VGSTGLKGSGISEGEDGLDGLASDDRSDAMPVVTVRVSNTEQPSDSVVERVGEVGLGSGFGGVTTGSPAATRDVQHEPMLLCFGWVLGSEKNRVSQRC